MTTAWASRTIPTTLHSTCGSPMTKRLEGLSEFMMIACILCERCFHERSLPGLADAHDSSCDPAGVCQDPTAAQVHQVDAPDASVSIRSLAGPLPRGQHRHDRVAAEHRRETCFHRRDNRLVGLSELIPQA